MNILNLGCGNRPLKGAINLDISKHHSYVDVVHDLNNLPWPFEDEQFDKIAALAVLEHLDIDLLQSINECWRILKPGGLLIVKLPLAKNVKSWDDPTHRRPYTLLTLDYFCPSTEYGKKYKFYTDKKWKYIKKPRANRSKSSLWATMEKI
jgi:SAM-dependent methyltransferase